MTTQYLCPICQNSLQVKQRSLICENNHSYDQAKEGYYNLLPVQFKHSKNPGDNKAMVNARRAFLEKGYYQPLIDEMLKLYHTHGNDKGTIFDAGCGEGFYSHQHKSTHNHVYGIDISKEAVKKAAKKYKDCHFSVGTLSMLPFSSESLDWITSVYAPIIESEFTRVLKPGAFLLTVTPAKDHLVELKKEIYIEAQAHDETKQPIEHLTLVSQHNLSYQMQLSNGEDTLNLLSMTPFAFKASEAVKEQLSQSTHFNCQADFLLRLYKK